MDGTTSNKIKSSLRNFTDSFRGASIHESALSDDILNLDFLTCPAEFPLSNFSKNFKIDSFYLHRHETHNREKPGINKRYFVILN